jgi:molecular chaperone GrpE (heat shock protein)
MPQDQSNNVASGPANYGEQIMDTVIPSQRSAEDRSSSARTVPSSGFESGGAAGDLVPHATPSAVGDGAWEIASAGVGPPSSPHLEGSAPPENSSCPACPTPETEVAEHPEEQPTRQTATDAVGAPAEEPSAHVATLRELSARIGQLDLKFDQRILLSDQQAAVIDRLHSELQGYRNDLYAQMLKPVLADLATVREHILKIASDQRKKPPEAQSVALDTFASFADDLGQILEENDVEIYRASPGEPVDPKRHRIVAKHATADESLHRLIVEVVGDGYFFRDRALTPERVTVYAYDGSLRQTAEPSNPPEGAPNG